MPEDTTTGRPDHWTPQGHRYPVVHPPAGRPSTYPCEFCGESYMASYMRECPGNPSRLLALVLKLLPKENEAARLKFIGAAAPELVTLLRDLHAGLRSGMGPELETELINRTGIALRLLDPATAHTLPPLEKTDD